MPLIAMRFPGARPAILRRPRNTAVAVPWPSLSVTSSAGAPARGTMRTDLTSPPVDTRVRGSNWSIGVNPRSVQNSVSAWRSSSSVGVASR
jgi:hypothetical protein